MMGRQFHRTVRTNAKRAGLTYAEMVVVVLMIGVLWSAAMPQYAESTNQTRVTAAALRVAAELNLARRDAKYRGVEREVDFNPGANRYDLEGMSHPDDPSENYRVELDEGVYAVDIASATFNSASHNRSSITFDMHGRPLVIDEPLVSGQVVVQFGGQSRSITVDPVTGKAEMQ